MLRFFSVKILVFFRNKFGPSVVPCKVYIYYTEKRKDTLKKALDSQSLNARSEWSS